MWFSSDNSKKQFIKISQEQFSKKYEIIESVGKGAYGEVFKAKSIHNSLVAIKKFKPEAVQQFHFIIREISNLKKMDHPNILKFYDCYIVNENRYYMVTEYCVSGSLANLIPNLTQDWEKMFICQQIAEGLSHAHHQNIVHRDLKPDNILIGAKNVAKIGDFGSSTRIQNSEVMTSRVGSPAYMDDRVDKRQDYDNTADIYSLGMVFICIFKGKGIYDECNGYSDLKRFKSEINQDYDNNIEEYINDLPQPIRDIVKNCLNPDYSIRLPAQTIANMIAAKLTKDKSGSRNLISTQDDIDEVVESEKNLFACNLIALNRQFEFKHRCLKTREELFKLLVDNQKNFEKISLIQKLKYVYPDAKTQFSFIVIVAYEYWLEQISLIINSDYSELQHRYRHIDPKTIDEEDHQKAMLHIKGERGKIAESLCRCAQKIKGTLHLMDQNKFIPQRFKEFVNQASQRENINFGQVSYSDLASNIRTFFSERIKKEYDYNRGDGEADDKLQVLRSISDGFL